MHQGFAREWCHHFHTHNTLRVTTGSDLKKVMSELVVEHPSGKLISSDMIISGGTKVHTDFSDYFAERGIVLAARQVTTMSTADEKRIKSEMVYSNIQINRGGDDGLFQ